MQKQWHVLDTGFGSSFGFQYLSHTHARRVSRPHSRVAYAVLPPVRGHVCSAHQLQSTPISQYANLGSPTRHRHSPLARAIHSSPTTRPDRARTRSIKHRGVAPGRPVSRSFIVFPRVGRRVQRCGKDLLLLHNFDRKTFLGLFRADQVDVTVGAIADPFLYRWQGTGWRCDR